MVTGNGTKVPIEEPTWQTVLELLASGQYETAAAMLEKTADDAGNKADPALKTLLRATREMCLAGNEYQAEAEFHKHAYHTASAREQQLREHLQALLGLIVSRRTASQQEEGNPPLPLRPPALLETKPQVPGILRRLQTLLGQSAAHPTGIHRNDEAIPPAESEQSLQSPQPESTGPALAVHCLGAFAVYHNDRLIDDWNGLKGLTILKYLVAQGGKPVPKDILMEVLWPNGDPESVRRNLHQAVYSLRQVLRKQEPDFQHILFQNDAYHFNPKLTLWIDFVQFERYARLGRQQEAAGDMESAMTAYAVADELYQGDFLEEDPYEEWAILRRERLRTSYLRITERLAAYHMQQEEHAAAAAIAQKALRLEPSYEAAHRWLIRCFIAQGQRHLAVRQYQTLARLLQEELDLEPSQESKELYERLKENEVH